MAVKISHLFSCLFLFTLAIPVLGHRTIKVPNAGKTSPFDFLEHLKGCHKGDKIEGLHEFKIYLKKFGYLSHGNFTSDDFDDALESALKTYQVNYHIKATGILDADTLSLMMTPRCGVPDIINGTNRMKSGDRDRHHTHPGSNFIRTVSHYRFFPGNPRWPASKTRLTYAFQANTPAYAISPVVRAFNRWASTTHFTFSRVRKTVGADLVIGFHRRDHGDGLPFDGRGGILAHAFAPRNGRFHFDADEIFSIGPVPGAYDVETIALHEIGHLLGLGHSSVSNAIMFPTIPAGRTKGLHTDDIKGIEALYNV